MDQSSDNSSIEGSASSFTGMLPHPKGEKESGHAGNAGEVSLGTLANNPAPAGIHEPLAGKSKRGEGVGPCVDEKNGSWIGSVDDEKEATKVRVNRVRASPKFAITPSTLAEDPEAHKKRKCDKTTCSACRFVEELYTAQSLVALGMNTVTRIYWQLEGEILDDYVKHNGSLPKKGTDWPRVRLNGYQIVKKTSPGLNCGIASAVATGALQKWKEKRWDALIFQKCSPPHYKDSAPIPIRAQEFKLVPTAKKDQYLARIDLLPGRGTAWMVPIKARDDYGRTILKSIATETWKHGAVQVKRDRKNRWQLTIAYKRLILQKEEGRSAAINKGMVAFLAGYTEDGDTWIYDGYDIIKYLKKIQRQRREYQYSSKASSRDGHGRKRMLKPTNRLSGKGNRWRQTRCQTIARRFVEWLKKKDVSTLYLEDFSGIRKAPEESLQRHKDKGKKRAKYIWDLIQEWPYYKLEMSLKSACDIEGIKVVNVGSRSISKTCPKCGGEATMDLNRRRLKCNSSKCKFRRHLDIAAAMNVLARGEAVKQSGSKDPKGLRAGSKGKRGGARKPSAKKAKSKKNGTSSRNK